VTTVGNLPNTRDKWQGGFVADDELGRSSIWCIPESAEYVLKVVTATGDVSLMGHSMDR